VKNLIKQWTICLLILDISDLGMVSLFIFIYYFVFIVVLTVPSLFYTEFDQSIDNLPYGLYSLFIEGGTFDQSIQSLPPDLEILHLDTYGLTVLDLDFLPDKLKYLHLSANSCGAKVEKLPHTLGHLSLTTESDQTPIPILALPPDLAVLALGGNYNPSGLGKLLPPRLTSLSLGYSFNEPLDSLPPSLVYLCVSLGYSQQLPTLPQTLRYFEQKSTDLDLTATDFPPR
jgi:hypothetical protein